MDYRELKEIRKKHHRSIMRKKNVRGVGIGHKIREGKEIDKNCVVVFVEKKIPKSRIAAKDLIPQTVDGIPTDVVEVGKIRALQLRTGKHRPAMPGISIGHRDITAGTFGAVVKEKGGEEPAPPPEPPPPEPPPDDGNDDGGQCDIALGIQKLLNHLAEVVGSSWRFPEPYKLSSVVMRQAIKGTRLILSNNHVLANSNAGKIGDAILQPGAYDGGMAHDKIATLLRFVPIKFDGSYNLVDAALCLPDADNLIVDDILGIGKVAGVNLSPAVGLPVKKSGRTTAVTAGRVLYLDATIQVDYDGPVAVFDEQIIAGPMSQGGDSGSLVLDGQNQAVGLLFAGSDAVTILNPISEVLNQLNVEF